MTLLNEPNILCCYNRATYPFGVGIIFLNFSTPVYKMWIIQEPNTLELWNKLLFEEEKNGEYIQRLKYSVPISVE